MIQITVIGEGAWGTALAHVLARNNHNVTLWCQSTEICETIAKTGKNDRYLPGFTFDKRITPLTSMASALTSSIIVVSTPVTYLHSVAEQMRPFVRQDHIWVFACKGIDQTTLLMPFELVANTVHTDIMLTVLSGPSFARQVMHNDHTAVLLAGKDPATRKTIKNLFEQKSFHLVETNDIIGTSYAGMYKNIIALGMGILTGSGYGENTKAWFLTCSLYEMKQLITQGGGVVTTADSLAGIGDLVLTAYSTESKNVRVGIDIGRGKKLSDLQEQLVLPEGINSATALEQWQRVYKSTLPISSSIYKLCHHTLTPHDFVHQLTTFQTYA